MPKIKKGFNFQETTVEILKKFGSKSEYITQWQKENYKRIYLKLNYHKDADIIAFLEDKESKNAYIKELIRKDMKRK
ncbi:MAG: hypothetical protein J6D29_01265 [Solobacterium sp.]|nr:hypothetical protein [Solobacterium sp.]